MRAIDMTRPSAKPVKLELIVKAWPRVVIKTPRGKFFCAAAMIGLISRKTLPRSRLATPP